MELMQKTWYKDWKKVFLLAIVVFSFMAGIERFTLPEITDDMERRALEFILQNDKELPPKPFVYDGCTFFVDSLLWSDFETACLMHDIAYWSGGTKEERKHADEKLAEEIKTSGFIGRIVAYPVYSTVRLFGDSVLTRSVDAHWGFGWD